MTQRCKECGEPFEQRPRRSSKKCLACHRKQVYETRNKRREEYPEEYATEVFNNRLWSMFRLRRSDYDGLVKNGCCCCGSQDTGSKKGWHVDHDHACCATDRSCGKCVRGVLCHQCNVAMGQVNDSIEKLEAMIAYLKRTSHG